MDTDLLTTFTGWYESHRHSASTGKYLVTFGIEAKHLKDLLPLFSTPGVMLQFIVEKAIIPIDDAEALLHLLATEQVTDDE